MNVKIIVNEGKWSYDEIVAAGKISEVFADGSDTMYLTIKDEDNKIKLVNLRSSQVLDSDLFDTDSQIFRKMNFTTITLS